MFWLLAFQAALLGLSLVAPWGAVARASNQSVALESIEQTPVNLNRASAAELERVRGLGVELAQRIVRYREQHGPYRALEDLLAVEGIGEAKLKRLESQVRL